MKQSKNGFKNWCHIPFQLAESGLVELCIKVPKANKEKGESIQRKTINWNIIIKENTEPARFINISQIGRRQNK